MKDKVEVIVVGVLGLLMFAIILLASLTPSCADRGGKRVKDGTTMQYNVALKMMMPVTKYKCEM